MPKRKSLNAPNSPLPRLVPIILAVILIGGVLHLGWLTSQQNSWARTIVTLWRDGKQKLVYANYEQVDNLLKEVTTAGNIILRLEGFNPTNENHAALVNTIYYRGSYAVFPKRIYVADE